MAVHLEVSKLSEAHHNDALSLLHFLSKANVFFVEEFLEFVDCGVVCAEATGLGSESGGGVGVFFVQIFLWNYHALAKTELVIEKSRQSLNKLIVDTVDLADQLRVLIASSILPLKTMSHQEDGKACLLFVDLRLERRNFDLDALLQFARTETVPLEEVVAFSKHGPSLIVRLRNLFLNSIYGALVDHSQLPEHSVHF